jgi:arabinosaccharide transport system substrate-binding protein
MDRSRLFSAVAWRFQSLADGFPFGLAPMVIVVLMLVSGSWLLFHPIPQNTATLRLWTFATVHCDAYKQAVPGFEAQHPGVTVDVELVHGDAITSRLQSAFWASLDVPDLVEVEISQAGAFFRGPVADVGFVDLTDWLKQSGYLDRIVKSRFSPYTSRGRVFGLPHDVHPVMLAYRRDLFERLGIDADKLQTWDDFVHEGRRVTKRGHRYMIQFSDVTSQNLEMLLFQRGGGYFDANGDLLMDNEITVETIKWYIPLVAGSHLIASDPGASDQAFTRAVEDGYILSFICPDWRSRLIERNVPQMAGKMALMPLPAFTRGGRRTSTWGGTMLGITKHCRNKELAWQLAQYLYFDRQQLAARYRETNILSPLKPAWDLPVLREPRPYWSDQPIGKLYAELAEQVPPQYVSPFTSLAKEKLGQVVSACASYYSSHGEEGFEAFVRVRLKQAADDVRRQMERNPF